MIEGDMVEHKTDRVYLRPHVPYPHDMVSKRLFLLGFQGASNFHFQILTEVSFRIGAF